MLNQLEIFNVGEKIRVGNVNDGGYVLPKIALENSNSLFSYGINDDIGFDENYIELTNNNVYGFDHTIEGIETKYPSKFTLYKEGLSSKKTNNTDNFLNHYKDLNISGSVLLKIDVEGCEYEFFNNTNIGEIAKIVSCVTIEFHSLDLDLTRNEFLNIVKNLNEFFYICHIHGNNWGKHFKCDYQNKEFDFPKVLEITFINKNIVNECKVDLSHYPNELDNPNNVDAPELSHDIFNTINLNKFKIYNYVDLKNEKVYSEDKIPKFIFRTSEYEFDDVPREIKILYYGNLLNNPEYKLFYFNPSDRLEFIKSLNDYRILNAYNNLIPGAFKADLWRYLILSEFGGVYMDFTLNSLIPLDEIIGNRDEVFVKELTDHFGVCNNFICSKKNNATLKLAIDGVINNVENEIYGDTALSVSGPIFLKEQYLKTHPNFNFDYQYVENNIIKSNITGFDVIKTKIDNHYSLLYGENYKFIGQDRPYTYYDSLWNSRTVFKNKRWVEIENASEGKFNLDKIVYFYQSTISIDYIKTYFNSCEKVSILTYKDLLEFENIINLEKDNIDAIPKIIFRTGKYKLSELPNQIKELYEIDLINNPGYRLFYFDDDDCYAFIKNQNNEDLLNAYDVLIPTAFKADLWRYAILYKYGGIYIDFTHNLVTSYDEITKHKDDVFVKDIVWSEHMFNGIYNAFMCTKPKNEIFKNALNFSVDKIKKRKKYLHPLDYTGPMSLLKAYQLKHYVSELEYQYIHHHDEYGTGSVVNIKTQNKVINCRIKNHYEILYGGNNITHYTNLVNEHIVYKDERWYSLEKMYLDVLKRPADFNGLVYHYSLPYSLDTIKKKLYKSEEYRNLSEFKNRTKKLDVFIISVNYNDFITITLKENIKIFDNIHVITSSSDTKCQEICKTYNVDCIITNLMFEEGVFNKGKSYNYALNKTKNLDYVLILDADIIVKDKIDLNLIDEYCFYYAARRLCYDYNSFINLEKIEDLEYEIPHGDGFFQLINMKNEIIYFSEDFKNCGGVDVDFREKFEERILLENEVIHLGEKELNWDGRITNQFIDNEEINKILNTYKNESN